MRLFNRLLPILSIVALGIVCFVGGAYVAEFKLPWYENTLQPSFRGLRALSEEREAENALHGWYPTRTKKRGVTVHKPEKAFDGYTLFASFDDSCAARLITMDGKTVHRWHLPFDSVWPEATHLPAPVPRHRMHWWRLKPFPNGDLIVNYSTVWGTPTGLGLVRIDRDSRLIWKFSECTHHDFDVDSEGNIYALVHEFDHDRVAAAPHLRTPHLKDYLVVISPDGKEQRRISLLKAFARSEFHEYLGGMRSEGRGDHTHTNSVDVISAEFAERHRHCSVGDIMLSLRNPSLLAILNLERSEIVWASKGTWLRQHDPDPLPNGNLLLFDNRGHQGKAGESRILEWNPGSGGIPWSFSGTAKDKLKSMQRGCQQPLPNGNVLITESNNGRILEVTREKEVVWQYINPGRLDSKKDHVAVIFNAERYARDDLPFVETKSENR